MTAHRHADIPDDLLSSTRCLFHFASGWQLLNQISEHHVSVHFYTRRNIHRGAYEETQASNTHQAYSTEANRFRILSQSSLHLWTLVFCFVFFFFLLPLYLLLISLLLSVLFLCCSSCFIFPFLHWPIVTPLTPPVWCRFGSVCLWTDSLLSNGANILLCGQSTVSWKRASNSNFENKSAASQNQAWTCGCTFLSGGGDARKERRKKGVKRESELRLESEGWRVASLLKTAPYLPTVSHAPCVVL